MIFAKPGESAQQYGGECPVGWVEMQSERPEGAFVANEAGQWVVLPKTLNEKLNDAIASYRTDVDTLTRQFTAARLADGAAQASKETQIRAALAVRKAEYQAEITAIKAGG